MWNGIENVLKDEINVSSFKSALSLCEKLQCLYENLTSNNFRKTAVLKKSINCKLKLQSKGLS